MPSSPIVLDYEPVSYSKDFKHFVKGLPRYFKKYISNLLPIVYWIHRYNLTWLVSDIIAGITVGIVAVPQSMGYAKIANLPAQYGLYSSFVGLCLYCFFGTSKDINIGPTAVMSLLVGQTVASATATGLYTGPQVAVVLALFGGFIALFIGLVRLGILVDFIPGPAIAGFMTGSSITISIGQWPKLFGISSVNTHDAAYLVFGNFFKHLPETRLDAAFGLVGLLWLYTVRWGTGHLAKKYPKYEKPFFFANIMRNGVLVIFGTLFSFLINIGKSSSPISILKDIPRGFTAMAVPTVDIGLLSQISGTLPSVVIILILEHVAIAKSFGRINAYKIDADQEIIAIGAANIIGSFFGAYPNTGSFSRTAIAARSGARTPLNGVFSALVVLLCLYALTPAFYYIPDAVLSAIIIHAVADLASGPKFLRHLYHVNLFELFIFGATVLITFFTTVEYGIYVSVGLSIVAMLFRIARPKYSVLGRIPVKPTTTYYDPNDLQNEKTYIISHDNNDNNDSGATAASSESKREKIINNMALQNEDKIHYIYVKKNHPTLGHLVEPPPDGVAIFRFEESLTYPNAGFISDKITNYIQDNFVSGSPPPTTKGNRDWNDRRPLVTVSKEASKNGDNRDTSLSSIHAIVLDCSAINHLDSTGVQTLSDLRLSINRFAGYEVEWHFAGINSPATRNALIASGFGNQAGRGPRNNEQLPVVPIYRERPQCNLNEKAEDNSKESRHMNSAAATTNNSTSFSSMYDAKKNGNNIQGDEPDLSVYKFPSIHSLYEQRSCPQESVVKARHPSDISNYSHMSHIINIDGKGQIEYYPRFDRGLPIDRYPFFHWDIEDAVRAASCTKKRRDSNS